MLPAYQPGTLVLGLKWLRPKVGSVVVADYQGREILKRVARVNQEGFFLLGDNATRSTDSRVYGWFAPGTIKSVIVGSIKR